MSGALLRHYRKDLLRPGTFVDERGRVVEFSEAIVLKAAQEMNRMIADGVRIPVVVGDSHPLAINESTANLAEHPDVQGFIDMAAVQGGWLRADIDARGTLPETHVSVWIEPKITAANGKEYGPAIRHVLLTDEPAVQGQSPFALLRSDPREGGRVGSPPPSPPSEGGARGGDPSQSNEKSKNVLSVVTGQWSVADNPTSKITDHGRIETKEVEMEIALLRKKLSLPDAADEKAIERALDQLTKAAAEPVMPEGILLKMGLTKDATAADVLAKLDDPAGVNPAARQRAAGLAPAVIEPEIPAALLARQRDVDHRLLKVQRKEFHHAIDALADPRSMRITPAIATKLKDRFPIAHGEGALLAAAKPLDEETVQGLVLSILGDLPAKNVLAQGATLKVASGHLPEGDELSDEQIKTERAKYAAAGAAHFKESA